MNSAQRRGGTTTGKTTALRMAPLLVGCLLVASVIVPSTSGAATVGGSKPTQVNVTNDPYQRFGEPQVVANPTNPNNLVYFVLNAHTTYACERAEVDYCKVVNVPGVGNLPAGLLKTPGFEGVEAFYSFDGGRTWAQGSDVPCCVANRPNTLLSAGDPNLTVTADGTFYIAWDIYDPVSQIGFGGGIAVSKSTDGGRHWSAPAHLTGTPYDRPWLMSDLSTGTLYVTSGSEPLTGKLGAESTLEKNAPTSSISDRWIVASRDGVHWTVPHRLGGGGVPGYSVGEDSFLAAGHGIVAVTFHIGAGSPDSTESSQACRYFVGTPAPCTVFETTTYHDLASSTDLECSTCWTRHSIPGLSAAGGTSLSYPVLVASDPTRAGHFTVAALDAERTKYLVYQTFDAGKSWTPRATIVTNSATTQKFKPWLSYSSTGVLGLMWRSYTEQGSGPNLPYEIWAAISKNGGTTFSAPLKISTAPSPAPDPAYNTLDDTSFLSLTGHSALVGWGDWRPGNVAGFFSAANLGDFKFR